MIRVFPRALWAHSFKARAVISLVRQSRPGHCPLPLNFPPPAFPSLPRSVLPVSRHFPHRRQLQRGLLLVCFFTIKRFEHNWKFESILTFSLWIDLESKKKAIQDRLSLVYDAHELPLLAFVWVVYNWKSFCHLFWNLCSSWLGMIIKSHIIHELIVTLL